jgi:hypothetical protein
MKALFIVLMFALTALPAFAGESEDTDCLATQDTESRSNPKVQGDSEEPSDVSSAVSV